MGDLEKSGLPIQMVYTESHEWVALSGQMGTVGITNYAQKELGEIVYIELPKVGRELQAGEEVCVLESTKAAVDVYSPVSGKIIAVNEELRASPSLVNKDPEKTGWLFRIEIQHLSECDKLLPLSKYQSLSDRSFAHNTLEPGQIPNPINNFTIDRVKAAKN